MPKNLGYHLGNLLILVIVLIGLAHLLPKLRAEEPDQIWILHVKAQNTYDTQGIEFFELRRGAEAYLISAPGQSDLAKWLNRKDGKRVSLTLGEVSR